MPEAVWPINLDLVDVVRSYHPDSVFEFGCNEGKNLRLLAPYVPLRYGLDMSEPAILKAKENPATFHCQVGTDADLSQVGQFDVVFTCSVLNHIPPPKIPEIIEQFKRIAKKAIVLAETQDIVDWYYFNHDYAAYGFKDTGYEWKSFHSDAIYKIWVLE